MGDFNSSAKEDPIKVFTDAGWTDLLATKARGQYTYTFDGELQSLDHVIASPAANDRVTKAAVWPINSPEWVGREYWNAATEAGTPVPFERPRPDRRRRQPDGPAVQGRHRPGHGQRLPRPHRAGRALRWHRRSVECGQGDPGRQPEHRVRGGRRHDRRVDVHVVHPEGRADHRGAQRRRARRELGGQPRVRPGLRRPHRPGDAAGALGLPRCQRLREGHHHPRTAGVLDTRSSTA